MPDPSSSPSTDGSAWGGGRELSDFDALMWRADRHPSFSNCVTILAVLDRVPEWDRVRATARAAIELVPRLGERISEPVVPVLTPVWEPAPEFDVDYHVRRVVLPAPAGQAELLAHAQAFALVPFDKTRPLWEACLVEGLGEAGAAVLFKIHHAMTDGTGFMQLLTLLQHLPRAADDRSRAPLARRDSPLNARRLLSAAARAGGGAGSVLARITRQSPVTTITTAVRTADSVARSLPAPTPPSPLLSGRTGRSWRFGVLECELADLKAACKASGASVNDGFLAALLDGLGRYHRLHGQPVDEITVMVPVNRRPDDALAGGNHLGMAMVGLPTAEMTVRERMAMIRVAVGAARAEPALGAVGIVAPILGRLPSAVGTRSLEGLCGRADLAASNVRGLTGSVGIAGAHVDRLYAFGPLTGAAVLVTMNSHRGTCCIGVNCDGSVIADADVLIKSFQEGLDAVLGA